jgi:DNA-directed RNA polymerase specialized sigma24 family protein
MNAELRDAASRNDTDALFRLAVAYARRYWANRSIPMVIVEAESRFAVIFMRHHHRFGEFRNPGAMVRCWARSALYNAWRTERRRREREAASVDICTVGSN